MDATEGESSDLQNVVAFRLGQQAYALPIEPIAQIIDMVAITPVPQLSEVVEGVINVHGEAVAVVKLRRHFDLEDAPLQLNTPILLTRISGQTIGLIVDEVIDVLNLPKDRIVQLGEILPKELGDAPIFRGLTYVADDATLMLDPDQLFRPDQLEALAQAVELLQQAITGKAQAEPGASPKEEPEPEPKPTRRRRKTAPKKKAAPAKTSTEPKSKPKTTRKRRKSEPTGDNA
ncbi:MAG: chemotaxis protein CheW [Anaerolineae bacterium]|jgi:purine-binding chemotaxis protein CheW